MLKQAMLASLAVPVIALPAAAETGPVYEVILDQTFARPGERLVAFDVKTQASEIAALQSLPQEWSIRIDNGPSASAHMTGSFGVGAAALEPRAVQHFFDIRMTNLPGLKPSLSVKLTYTHDFVHERSLTVPSASIRIVPAPGAR